MAILTMLGIALPTAAQLVRIPSSAVEETFVANQLIVRFPTTTTDTTRALVHAALGSRLIDRIPELNADLVSVADIELAQRAYNRTGLVEASEPNFRGHVTGAPPPSRTNDPLVAGLGASYLERQWYLNRIGAPYAWTSYPQTYYSSRTRPRTGVKVAVLDTMIDVEHRDWRNAGGGSSSVNTGGQIASGDTRSFIAANKAEGKNLWHGTFIAGIIAASTDNETDMAGIAYGAQIMPVAVAEGSGATTAFAVSRGVTYATDRGADIINISMVVNGASSSVSTLRNAVSRATSRGILVVTSVGNSDADDADYPAGFAAENPSVLAVGASNIFDERDVRCSKKGRHLSLLAPGVDIWSLDPQDKSNSSDRTIRRETCGASYAAAVVSGVAALVAGAHPTLRGDQIAKRILAGADDLGRPGRDDETGAGRVNAERAVWSKGGPGTAWLSIPTAGPAGKATLAGSAVTRAGVTAAEVLIDGRQRGKGVAARATDGRFGSGKERVAVTVDTTNFSEGPHEVHVRARDALGVWGPAATSVLIVDRTKPVVGKPKAFPTDLIDPDYAASAVHLSFADAWSRTSAVQVDLLDAALTSQVTFKHPALPNGTHALTWKAIEKLHGGPLTPGAYRIVVRITDRAGLSDYNEAPMVVGATLRIVASPGSSNAPSPGGVGVPTAVPTAVPSPTSSAIPTPTSAPTPSQSPSPSPAVTAPPLPTGTPTGRPD